MRGRPATLLEALIIASAGLVACWQLALTSPALLAAAGAIALASIVIAVFGRPGWLAGTLRASEPVRRAAALRRKSRAAVFQRQRNPDAAGHARPRAPADVPAAA